MLKVAAAAAALLAAAPALPREVAGVKLAPTVTVDGKELRLNGAGVRKKFIVKVYVGALYLEAPSADPAAIVAADAAKQVQMIFLRGGEKKQILGAFKDGFEANSSAEAPALTAQLKELEPALADMKEGGVLTVTYVPGKGTVVTGPGGTATVEGKPFADALFRNWLGQKPADDGLKEGMLGK